MNIIIPIGGLGERFKKEGYTQPKPLIPVLGKPIISYVLDNIRVREEDRIYILYNTGLTDHGFVDYIEEKYPTVRLIPINRQTGGAAETLHIGVEIILQEIYGAKERRTCMVMDCDTFYTADVVGLFAAATCNAVFYTKTAEMSPIFSYIQLGEDGKGIIDIREKQRISDNANTGIYCFNDIAELHSWCGHVVSNNIRFNGEFYTSCVISEMIGAGCPFTAIELAPGDVHSLGTPSQVDEFISSRHAFLFDLDGTLVLTDHIYTEVWKELLRQHEIALTADIYDRYIRGHSDSTVVARLIPHHVGDISAEKDALTIRHIDKLEVVDGAVEFIRKVRAAAHKIAVVTNCNRRVAEAILDHMGCSAYIDVLVIGGECKRPKPYPDPYIAALGAFKDIPASRAIVFEDSKTGITSGNGIHPKCIVGLQTHYGERELIEAGASIVVQNYTNIDINCLMTHTNNDVLSLEKYVIASVPDIHDISWVAAKLKGGYISDVLALGVEFADGARRECVLKLENQTDSYLSKMANKVGLYEREYYFYESISKYVPVRVPRCYGIVKNAQMKNIGILMENVVRSGCGGGRIGLDLNTENVDVSLKVIAAIARMHAKFWGLDLQAVFPLLRKNNDTLFKPGWSEYVRSRWPLFKEKWTFMLSPEQLAEGDAIVSRFDEIQDYLSSGDLTLLHGDVKSGNIVYSEGDKSPCFLDWQYVIAGKGVQDLVFFMIESFDVETLRHYRTLFQEYYYTVLGIPGYGREEYMRDIWYAARYYPFFVAVWFGTTPDDDLIDKNFPYFFIQKLFSFMMG